MRCRHLMPLRPRRSVPPAPLARALPALVLGVSALALAVPSPPPAAAAPTGPAAGSPEPTPSGGPDPSTTGEGRRQLTAAARRAGLEVGNATMGWRERGSERALPVQRREGLGTPAAAAARSTTFTPDGVLGVDVASYQGNLRWSTWTTRDRRFAYVKATEGTTYRNPYFARQYGGANRAGMIRGAYHFANPGGRAGYRQARYFVRNGGGWSADGTTLPGVLDIEYNPYGSTCYGVSRKKMVAWISSFTREYKRLTGRDAVIYTTTDWWTRCTGNTSRFARTNPLWIARYGTTQPGTLPRGWTSATIWQYTASPIDQDVFLNSYQQLRALATEP